MNPSETLTPQEVAIFKAMSPAQKLALAARFYADARQIKRAALKMQHPDWPEAQIETKLREIFLFGTG
jgi:hypothetical protein